MAVLEDLIHEGKLVQAIEMFDSLRTLLYQTDQRLIDCQQLLRGYLGISVAQEEATAEAPPDTASEVQDDSAS